jgi:hypothetical protein
MPSSGFTRFQADTAPSEGGRLRRLMRRCAPCSPLSSWWRRSAAGRTLSRLRAPGPSRRSPPHRRRYCRSVR